MNLTGRDRITSRCRIHGQPRAAAAVARSGSSLRQRLVFGAMLVALLGVLSWRPALADEGGHDHGRGRADAHERAHGHARRGERERQDYPVYRPDPVYYPPVVSPGISLIFPIRIR